VTITSQTTVTDDRFLKDLTMDGPQGDCEAIVVPKIGCHNDHGHINAGRGAVHPITVIPPLRKRGHRTIDGKAVAAVSDPASGQFAGSWPLPAKRPRSGSTEAGSLPIQIQRLVQPSSVFR
jgi:hypothetical protein